MEFDALSKRIIGCAIEVHRTQEAGLLESVYRRCLEHELSLAGLRYESEKPIDIACEGIQLESANLCVDLIVENALVVESKAVERLLTVHHAQLLNYMKLAKCKIGLLINFYCRFLKDRVKRFVL